MPKKSIAIPILLAAGLVGVWRGVPLLHPQPALAAPASVRAQRAYTTKFPRSEKPISERGKWMNGRAVGLDWADAATTPGRAFGLESGSTGYDDSVALLKGSWSPDQTVEAKVFTTNQNAQISEEVELRLRSTLSPHSATGYEVNFRCLKTKDAYSEIVRWNGPLDSFTYLQQLKGAQYGVADGDVVKATIAGNVITTFINGVQVGRATDGMWATGQPGMGFFLKGPAGLNRDYGFTSFAAYGRR